MTAETGWVSPWRGRSERGPECGLLAEPRTSWSHGRSRPGSWRAFRPGRWGACRCRDAAPARGRRSCFRGQWSLCGGSSTGKSPSADLPQVLVSFFFFFATFFFFHGHRGEHCRSSVQHGIALYPIISVKDKGILEIHKWAFRRGALPPPCLFLPKKKPQRNKTVCCLLVACWKSAFQIAHVH